MALRRPAPHLVPLVQEAHRHLFGRPALPDPHIALYPYVEGRSTVRLEGGRIRFNLNSAFAEAPEEAVLGIAATLLARLHRVRDEAVPEAWRRASRTFLAERPAAATGRKHIDPVGAHRSLLESYLRVTLDMGLVLPQVPRLSWSRTVAGHRFGHWDADHNVIVLSQILDDPDVPEFVLDYVLYHELLHILHPVRMGSGSRRIVHSAAFRRDERRYPQWREGEAWIGKLARRHRRARR
ncbi:MAG: hypothetical protein AABX89_07090 [Candidatus Thermoplasmatota archaeon]